MAIDYTTDILSLYAGSVVADPEYAAVAASNRNQPAEQRILTTMEVVRAHMAELRSEQEARLFHYCMSRMLAGVAYNNIYDDVSASVEGNLPVTASSFADGDTVTVVTASGVDAVVLDDAPYADAAAVVADINSQFANTDEVEAYTANGRIGFRNTSGNIGVPFALDYGANPAISVLVRSSIEAGEVFGSAYAVAATARDDALAHFERSGRPDDSDL